MIYTTKQILLSPTMLPLILDMIFTMDFIWMGQNTMVEILVWAASMLQQQDTFPTGTVQQSMRITSMLQEEAFTMVIVERSMRITSILQKQAFTMVIVERSMRVASMLQE